ncbi:VOC family protein [Halobacillus sp. B23F22_1]|uniref:VOC family protein n=1 Tax=Halobacillus sp. B23F22_1 TaxID=3459514 RepID=UPI00373F3733
MFQIHGVFVPVTDLERSKSWYEEHLGLIKADEWDEGAGYVFPSGSMTIALIKVENTEFSTEFTIEDSHKNVYFNLKADDIEAAHRKLKANQVEVTPIEDFEFMAKFDSKDPDGNTISIVSEKPSSPFHKNQIKKLQEVKF